MLPAPQSRPSNQSENPFPHPRPSAALQAAFAKGAMTGLEDKTSLPRWR